MTHSTALAISIAITFSGFMPLAIVLYKRRRDKQLRQIGVATTGMVEGIKERRGAKGVKYYYAVIVFPVRNGPDQWVHFHFTSTWKQKILYRGKPVNIIYDPAKPKRFVIKEVPQSNGLLIFVIIIAIAYVIIGFKLYETMMP